MAGGKVRGVAGNASYERKLKDAQAMEDNAIKADNSLELYGSTSQAVTPITLTNLSNAIKSKLELSNLNKLLAVPASIVDESLAAKNTAVMNRIHDCIVRLRAVQGKLSSAV